MAKLSDKRWETALLIGILCAAAALRLYRIQDEPVWFDEAVSTAALDQPSLGSFFEEFRANDPTAMPLYFTLEYVVASVTGGGIVAVRVMSVALSLLTIFLVYLLGRHFFGGTAGLVAAALLALSKPHIYYSQEIRMYALFLPLAQISMMTFIGALVSNRRAFWILNVLTNCAIIWTHLFGSILLLTEGLFLLLVSGPHPIRRALVWTLGHAPFFAPIPLWLSAGKLNEMNLATNWISLPTWFKLHEHYFYFCSGSDYSAGNCMQPHFFGLPTHGLPGLFMACSCIWLVVWTFRHRVRTVFRSSRAGSWALTFRSHFALPEAFRDKPGFAPLPLLALFTFLIAPPLILFAISFEVRPFFVSRYVFYPALAFCVLAGAGAGVVRRDLPRIAAIALLLAPLALQLPDLKRPLRYDYNTAARIIEAYGDPGDYVFTHHEVASGVLALEKILTGKHVRTASTFREDALTCVGSGISAWVIIPVTREYPTADFDEKLQHLGYKNIRFYLTGSATLAIYRIEAYPD